MIESANDAPSAIAPAEPSVPDELSLDPEWAQVNNPLWFVVHTRPRAEKKIAKWLKRNKMEFYLPLRQQLRVYPSKKIVFEIPLFSGYLFAQFAPRDRYRVFSSDYVANILFSENQPKLMGEMEQIRQLLASGEEVAPHPYLEVGERVVVTSGKLKGMEGLVEKNAGKHRLIISVELFQQSVCVEVDPRILKPAI